MLLCKIRDRDVILKEKTSQKQNRVFAFYLFERNFFILTRSDDVRQVEVGILKFEAGDLTFPL